MRRVDRDLVDRALVERLLAYGPQRAERCVCGGIIAARDGDWNAIGEAIRIHNVSTGHVDWRVRVGVE